MATDVILATIANGGQSFVNINREAIRNELISCLIHYLILIPLKAALAKPFHRGCRGWGMLLHKNHAAGEANGSIIVGMFVRRVFC